MLVGKGQMVEVMISSALELARCQLVQLAGEGHPACYHHHQPATVPDSLS